MKRKDLERALESYGFRFLRDSTHCIWSNGRIQLAVPHHKELNRHTANKLIKTAKASYESIQTQLQAVNE